MRRLFAHLVVLFGVQAAACSPSPFQYVPYRLINPDQIFSGLPGAPKRPQGVASQSAALDQLGYQVAGDIRVVAAISSKRPGNAEDLYDVDFSVRILVLPTAERAEQTFSAENKQDLRFSPKRNERRVPEGLQADQAVAWSTSGRSEIIVVQARYGNYLVRYVGKIVEGGYFPEPSQFFEAFRSMDRHVKHTLESAA